MAGELVIDASAVAAYGGRLAGASGAVQSHLLNAMRQGTDLVAAQGRANAPHGPTGDLADSIRPMTVTPTLGTVGTDIKYARWVHDGRGPVRPVNAKVLHFMVGGAEVFTKYAGPSKPNPFLDRALREMEGRVAEIFAAEIAAALREVGA